MGHPALIAAKRFATTLVAQGDELSASEREVICRALLHHLDLALRELGIVDLRTEDASR